MPCGNCLSKHFYDGHVGVLWNSDIIINISDIIIINYDIRNINYDISAFTYSRLINATSQGLIINISDIRIINYDIRIIISDIININSEAHGLPFRRFRVRFLYF